MKVEYSITVTNFKKTWVSMLLSMVGLTFPAFLYFTASDFQDWWIFLVPIIGSLIAGLFYPKVKYSLNKGNAK